MNSPAKSYRVSMSLLALLLCPALAFAQAQSVTAQSASVTFNVPASTPLAVNDEAYALAEGLVRELRKGGFILFVHSGAVLPGTKDVVGKGEWWRNCETTQKLAPQANPQAQAISIALTRQRILIDGVQTSELCRAYDTGVFLGFTTPQRLPALNPLPVFQSQKKTATEMAAGLQTLLSLPVAPGRNHILVGHATPAGLVHPALSGLGEGQTAIFKPEANGHFHHITTLTPGQWQWIGRLTILDPIAQAAVANPLPPIPPQPPLIDPAKELKGVALVMALRKGGYNLYMRHALSTNGADKDFLKTPNWWDDCSIQRNISDAGREQAMKVGAAIRELKIPIGPIKAAQFCRTRDTATLLGLGTFDVDEGLNHVIGQRPGFDVNSARLKLITAVPPKGKNTLLVSHTHGTPHPEERIMGSLAEAEIAVYKPDGKGSLELVARINLAEWDNLIKLMNAKP